MRKGNTKDGIINSFCYDSTIYGYRIEIKELEKRHLSSRLVSFF